MSPFFTLSISTLSSGTNMELSSLPARSFSSVGALDAFVDNIPAVPEPSSVLLALAALSSGQLRRARKS